MRAIIGIIALLLIFSLAGAQAQSYPVHVIRMQTITAAESSDDDQLTTATSCANVTAVLVTTFLAQPDVTRNLIFTPSGSATGSMKITGTNFAGSAITENVTFTDGSVKASTKAFKTVTRIDGWFTQAATRTMKIGTGDLLGLQAQLPRNTVLMAFVNGVREATAPAVTFSSTVLCLNTIDTSTAPGGYNTVVYYST